MTKYVYSSKINKVEIFSVVVTILLLLLSFIIFVRPGGSKIILFLASSVSIFLMFGYVHCYFKLVDKIAITDEVWNVYFISGKKERYLVGDFGFELRYMTFLEMWYRDFSLSYFNKNKKLILFRAANKVYFVSNKDGCAESFSDFLEKEKLLIET